MKLLKKVQVRYKKSYDARLRKQSEGIRNDDYVHIRVEQNNHKHYRHKLAPVGEGSFKVSKADKNTVTI